jgi:DNA-binding NarL/FixJ family response regulator
MEGLEGIDSFKLLRARVPHVPIVIVSASEDRGLVQQALDRGAHGYIPKSSTGKTMIGALRVVLSGGIYLPPTILDTQKNPHIEAGLPAHSNPEAKAEPPDSQSSLGLTLRQLDVLSLLCKGMPNKEICRILEVSEGTVKRHVTEILRKLNVSNRTQAVMTAQALGISVDK